MRTRIALCVVSGARAPEHGGRANGDRVTNEIFVRAGDVGGGDGGRVSRRLRGCEKGS